MISPLRVRSLRPLVLPLLLAPCVVAGSAWAEPEDEREFSAESAPRPADMPLSPLPEVPDREPAAPRPQAIEALDGILQRLVSPDPVIVERAAREIYEAKADWVGAISRRIDALAERADREGMKTLLETARTQARKGLSADEPTPDYLTVVLRTPQQAAAAYRDVVGLLALARMLRSIETVEATRELIRIHVRFGEFVRIDIQRLLDELGDRAVAALIEAQRHPAEKIALWARRQLDLRGKAIAHEAVRTEDQQALSDILVALGSTRDPDAARILISFAGTERSRVRLAARQGIVLLGEVAAWPLRDAYQDITGRNPPRDWTWKRTARELFTEYDRMRLAQAYAVFERAKQAQAAGRLEEMRAGFDRVLTLSPLFEQRAAMAPLYLEFARAQGSPPDQALLAARRALRITDSEATRQQAESLIQTLLAEEYRRRGLFDRGLLDHAISLDPTNDAARLDRSSGGRPDAPPLSPLTRYAAALAVCALALLGAVWVLWTARRPQARTPTAPAKNASTGTPE